MTIGLYHNQEGKPILCYIETNWRILEEKSLGYHDIITAKHAREESKQVLGEGIKGKDPSKNSKKLKNEPNLVDLALKPFQNTCPWNAFCRC